MINAAMIVCIKSDCVSSKSQYEKKLSAWRVRKNRMRKEYWRFINRRMIERRREGKDSEVYIDGILCPPARVRREASRHDFVPILDKCQARHGKCQSKGEREHDVALTKMQMLP